jgi:hypothetical protein
MVMALGVVEHDSRVIGIGAALTLAGNIFATVVIGLLLWAGIKALGLGVLDSPRKRCAFSRGPRIGAHFS